MTNQKSEQPPLLIEELPTYEDREVEVGEVIFEAWGAGPDKQLKRNVAMAGLLMPVIFEVAPRSRGKLRIVEGRRRFQAAVEAGFTAVPGRVLTSKVGVGVHALHLAGNAHRSSNHVMDLLAVEEIMVATGTKDAGEIARRCRIPLSDVKRILRLQVLRGEIRDAWQEGKITNAVGVAASKLEPAQQDKLVAILAANGTITMADVAEVKKTAVRSHQRKLPSENWMARTVEALRKAEDEIWENLGACDALDAVRKAIEAVEELEDAKE